MKKELFEKYFADIEYSTIGLPIVVVKEEDTYCIAATDEAEAMIGQSAYSQGKTREEAEKDFWNMIKMLHQYHEERSRELDLWKPFQKGDWGHIGGTWFTIFGFHVYFRSGQGMKGGWYVPGTKLNISISNYWRHRKNKKDDTTQKGPQV